MKINTPMSEAVISLQWFFYFHFCISYRF